VRHPECDLRGWLAGAPTGVDGYTADRIARSYAGVETMLDRCPGVARGAIYDVGCGAGFDSFAWGAHFDRVVAIDSSRRAIAKARRIARAAGITHVEFEVADALRHDPGRRFDLVWCNLMSHNVPSRGQLLDRLAEATCADGGWLLYAEMCEGYPAMEAHGAEQAGNEPELTDRLRQALNGLLGRPSFRFFASETAAGELAARGMEPVDVAPARWSDLVSVESVAARAGEPPRKLGAGDDDYSVLPDWLARVREPLRQLVAARPRRGWSRDQRARVEALAGVGSQAAALVPLVLMADERLRSLRPTASLSERLRRLVRGAAS
jgi:SAM-dependent methyltransferase